MERLDEGEVSPYLTDVLRVGDLRPAREQGGVNLPISQIIGLIGSLARYEEPELDTRHSTYCTSESTGRRADDEHLVQ